MVIFLRRLVLAAAVIGMVICVVLLLNFTAPNPTHRRYSSETVLTTEAARGDAIGAEGERILTRDLDQPNNNDRSQRLCICGTGTTHPPAECQVCITHVQMVLSYRIPDFVTDDYIAEVKNRVSLSVNERSIYNQLRDYAAAADNLGIPFWLFVRTNTRVPDEIDRLVEATGGDVVYYLAVPGYSDPVDRAAGRGLAACGAAAAGLLLWELRVHRRLAALRWPRLRPMRASAKDPRAPIDDAEQLLYRVKSRADRVRAPDEPPDRPGEPPPA